MNTNGEARGEAMIRNPLDDHAKALCAKDADAIVTHLAPDIVTYDLAQPLPHTGAEARNTAEKEARLRSWKGPVGLKTCALHIEIGGDIAFPMSPDQMSGKKQDGTDVELRMRTTTGLRRIGGDWKIMHSHASIPFYMDGSFRTVTGLKP